MGMVSASRPDGLTAPVNTSAIAPPAAWPRRQTSTIAGTEWSQCELRMVEPLDQPTTTSGFTATTATCLPVGTSIGEGFEWWLEQRHKPLLTLWCPDDPVLGHLHRAFIERVPGAAGQPHQEFIGDPDDAIDEWVVAGHSLGGAMAARYAEQERDELVGLLFYAAYPVIDMSGRSDLTVMSVYGTADGVADPADIEDRKSDLPPATEYVAIDGGIHSFFGDYGLRRGDGTPGVSREQAQSEIADASIRFLETVENQ